MKQPDLLALAYELRIVIQEGLRESALLRRAGELEGLLDLACVQPRSEFTDSETQESCRLLVDVVGKRVLAAEYVPDSVQRDGLRILFGVGDLLSLEPAPQRREEAARKLLGAVDPKSASFLKRQEPAFRGFVAEKLLAYDRTFQARRVRGRMELGEPTDPQGAAAWLLRFEYYYRVYTAASGIANDFAAYVKRKSRDTADAALPTYELSSLYFFAMFLYRVDQHLDERGGIWMFSDSNVDERVADLVYRISWHPPVDTLEEGRLITMIDPHRSPNPVSFLDALMPDERGRRIADRWSEWLRRCRCEPDRPAEQCEVHLVIKYCEEFQDLVDSEFYKIGAWYQAQPTRPRLDSTKVAELYEQHPYRLRSG